MIGFYNYTVLLTYLSLVSAGAGIFVSLAGAGHPYIGMFFLMACGLFDAFDGKVARTKSDRNRLECNFGIQIDSLCDLVSFGVLPACIGGAVLRRSVFLSDLRSHGCLGTVLFALLFAVLILYILAAVIRLAYFNVTEEERQKIEGGARKHYLGLPVTASALIIPTFMLFHFITPNIDSSIGYFFVIVLTGTAFLLPIRIPKPGLRGILILITIGVVEFIGLFLFWIMQKNGLR